MSLTIRIGSQRVDVRNVATDRDRRAAFIGDLFDDFGDTGERSARRADRRPFGCEMKRYPSTDALARTGHYRHLSFEPAHRSALS